MKVKKFCSLFIMSSLLVTSVPPCFAVENTTSAPISTESEIEGNRYVLCKELTATHYVTQSEANRTVFANVGIALLGGGIGELAGAVAGFIFEQILSTQLESPQVNDYLVGKLFITYDRQLDVFVVDYTEKVYRNGLLVINTSNSTQIYRSGRVSQAYYHFMNIFSYKIHPQLALQFAPQQDPLQIALYPKLNV